MIKAWQRVWGHTVYKILEDLEAVVILSAKFGPMFVKYLQAYCIIQNLPRLHLFCKATCSLKTDKRLGNKVASVDEYSQIVTALPQQLGDRIMHIMYIFLMIKHI